MSETISSGSGKQDRLATVRYAFRTIIWPRRKLLFVGLILIVINRLSGLILPGSSKLLIDDIITPGDTALLTPLL